MQTKSRRAFLAGTATASTALAAGCVPIAFAATSPDAELIRRAAEFDRIIADDDAFWAYYRTLPDGSAEAAALSDENDGRCEQLEAGADRVMAIPPRTLAGLVIWARIMIWRFDAELRAIQPKPSDDLVETSVNEAFALAAAIERIAAGAGQS